VTGATWRVATRIMTVVGDLVQRNGDGQAQVVYSVAGRSRGRLTLCVVCTVHKETRSVGFLVWPQNQGRQVSLFGHQNRQLRFGDLSLKITVIVFGLDLKTKWAIICRLCYKTDGMRTARDTHRDLMPYFAWKQVKLGFPSLPQNWWRCDNGWCMWHHRRDRMEMKLNTGGSMRRATSDSSIPRSSFICTRP
jgi:hypothetical protein